MGTEVHRCCAAVATVSRSAYAFLYANNFRCIVSAFLDRRWLVRLPDIPVGGLVFYRDSSFFLFSPCTLRARSTELERKPATWSYVSAIWKWMSKIWGIPLQIGGPKTTFFRRLRNSTANLEAYIFGTKHDTDNCKGSPTSSQNDMNFGPQTGPPFIPTIRKFCVSLHCRTSTKLRHTVEGKLR